ncbi:MAG: helix-turn-helix transcriptional regulator [Eubacteriales bacterium]|nr:helix-turn-helix transcriptional regulator [Eubacteriales bacterium]MDD4323217.1 helix-turn-helix transcriptional regulator [Eubacteriales bacterium]MDD4542090.1 helix-turn-helix transcriptional regulator [Eubacteriales bacterium]
MSDKYSRLCQKNFQKMQGFMEVCLLLLLYKESGHGYGLIEGLSYFGFTEENLNLSTLYKTLRRMENDGLVRSLWEMGDQGPKKRVYDITDLGRQELEDWVDFLRLRVERIGKVIDRYEKITL